MVEGKTRLNIQMENIWFEFELTQKKSIPVFDPWQEIWIKFLWIKDLWAIDNDNIHIDTLRFEWPIKTPLKSKVFRLLLDYPVDENCLNGLSQDQFLTPPQFVELNFFSLKLTEE